MSYDLYIHALSSKERMLAGADYESMDHEPIPAAASGRFFERLEQYGFETVTAGVAFRHPGQAIDVNVYDGTIAFVAGGDDIFDALMTASELCDDPALALFDPQVGEWND